ncbi:ferredoxin [Rhodopirellula sp. JC740]|uniref:Ferredoxin n=1 Tax=Rhodopirellula halodulae TaxID=2894198 RepID=A0ABS8NIW5_9BACT|nr:ferredoxin [Rhodopirellula sp. JC740]
MNLRSMMAGVAAACLAFTATISMAQCMPCGGCSDPCGVSTSVVSSGCGGAIGCGQGYVVPSASYTGGYASSCGTSVLGGTSVVQSVSPARETICEPVVGYRVVMKPTYVTETRMVNVTESQPETRFRTRTVYKTVPVTEENYRTKVVNVPKTDTKTIKYSVLVPVKEEKQVQVTESVPQWNEVPEEYTVRVPTLVDVPETYTVKVAKLVDESFTYTVNVPQAVTTQKTRTVVNAVPVTKSRTIEVAVPTTTMKTVTKDYGHWEEQVVEVAAAPVATNVAYSGGCQPSLSSSSACGCVSRCGGCRSCGGCVSSCGGCNTGCGQSYAGCGGGVSYAASASAGCGSATTTVTKRVWVPNVVTEEVPVTTSTTESQVVNYTVYEQQATQVPYECTTIVYQPETRTGTKKVVKYVDETRSRTRKEVQYNEETRTRVRKHLTYTSVTKTETIPYVTYKTEERTKEVSFTYNVPEYTVEPYTTTRYDQVAEQVIEEYTVDVPVTVTKEKQVQVCKMVPTLVEESFTPCTESISAPAVSAPIHVGPSVMMGGDSSGCSTPIMYQSAPSVGSGCGSCGATVSASPCTGC